MNYAQNGKNIGKIEVGKMENWAKQIIAESGYIKPTYDKVGMETFQDLYDTLMAYACKNGLKNTVLSLNLVASFFYPVNKEDVTYSHNDNYTSLTYVDHALWVANMLVDIRPEITKEEEDIVLSVALCHTLVEKIAFPNNGRELVDIFHLDERILEIIYINLRDKTKRDMSDYYRRIQENKLALLVKLADRSYVVGTLSSSTIQVAQGYIRDTKQNFFSMCIYGKEHYPDLYLSFGLFMEKMRCLVDVTDILSSRFIARENILNNEILALKEENARLRQAIRELKK